MNSEARVNEVVVVDGQSVKCVARANYSVKCDGCVFSKCMRQCMKMNCKSTDRADGTNVYYVAVSDKYDVFKKLKTWKQGKNAIMGKLNITFDQYSVYNSRYLASAK